MERQILHVDMDAFYASVEQRDDPSLRGKPLIVGGPSRRGVVTAASYEARPFGVRSAMSMVEALRLCPQAIVVPPRMSRYAEVSKQVFAIFHRYTPLVEGLSLDEAFLDVTGSRALFGDGPTIAAAIKRDIREDLSLTASAGVAPCKFAAKIGSDLKKPDGLVVVTEEGLSEFLRPLPIERMWGIGPKAAARLRPAGFRTFDDLARAPLARLEDLLGPAYAIHVQTLARGIDDRPVVPGRAAVSVGAEETFEHDLDTRRAMELRLLELAGRVARRLLDAGLTGASVTLKVKYADFTLKTRSLTLSEPVLDRQSLYQAATSLLDRAPPGRVRLLGISVSGLAPASAPGRTLSLFPDAAPERRRKLEDVMAKIDRRFGAGQLRPAALLEEDEDDGRG
ncbi:MAG: DNA polymerase IV [Byssovorax sp.]